MRLDYQDFMIFFTVLLFWVSIQFGELVEDSIAYGLVLTLGIVHGANDLVIMKKGQKEKANFFKSLASYLFLILLCVISYVISPFVSLLLFILISSYHFGEQHFEEKISLPSWMEVSIYMSYGLIIFSLIFLENESDVDKIVGDLTQKSFSTEVLLATLIGSSSVLIILFLVALFRKIPMKVNWLRELFYLGLLYLVFRTGSLMMSFAIYFIFWHSIPSIIDQTKYISGSLNKLSLITYFKTAGIIWVISITSLILAYYLAGKELFQSIIFLILFAVTAPHVWVMYKMKDSINE